MSHAINLEEIKQIEQAIEYLQSLGLDNVCYLADFGVLAVKLEDISLEIEKKAIPYQAKKSTVEVFSDLGNSIASEANSALITVGERIKERKLSKFFKKSSLKLTGIAARNLYKAKYGNIPEKNAKQTYVYNKEIDLDLIDKAIDSAISRLKQTK